MDGLKFCKACRDKIALAVPFNVKHYGPRTKNGYASPPAFATATRGELLRRDGEIKDADSYLFIGPPGRGKTHLCWAILQSRSQDPRVTVAAYSWPDVLSELRRSYGLSSEHPDKDKCYQLLEALRTADIAMIDDLAAEKVTEANADWIRGELFRVLDWRWKYMKQTLLTSNLPTERKVKGWPEAEKGMLLSDYLGERISSRVTHMCSVIAMVGLDRRRGAR